jgi:hypothetical protein
MKPAPRPLSPGLLKALGKFLYVLTHQDGRLQVPEFSAARQWLAAERYGGLALEVLLWRPDPDEPLTEAYESARQYLEAMAGELDHPTRCWLVALLTSVAEAHEGISVEEARFLEQIRHDLERLPAVRQVSNSTTPTFA